LTAVNIAMRTNEETERLLRIIASIETSIEFYTQALPELEKKHQDLLRNLPDTPLQVQLNPSFTDLRNLVDHLKQLRVHYLDELVKAITIQGAITSLAET
jgi:hypothetical protein